MTIREQRQEEAVNAYLTSDGKSIIYGCPRFGKIRVALEILKRLDEVNPKIFIPRNDIKDGWLKEAELVGYDGVLEFHTFRSLDKIIWFSHQFIIIDEPHEMSLNCQKKLAKITNDPRVPRKVLGLTGTMTNKTRAELYNNLNLDVCYQYSILQGVEEGILSDYQIFIHEIKLDDSRFIYSTKKKKYTEQGYFNLCEYLRKDAEGRNKKFMELKMIKILQDSMAKMEYTRKLISTYKDERILIFCGTTKIADSLGIPVYHSKAREKKIFDDFCAGIGDKLATIKMMQAGITITPISKGILNYTSGNPEDSAQKICRFLGFEYNNPNKKAEIHLISSNEDFEKERLKTALQFFDQGKIIKYV